VQKGRAFFPSVGEKDRGRDVNVRCHKQIKLLGQGTPKKKEKKMGKDGLCRRVFYNEGEARGKGSVSGSLLVHLLRG